MITLEKLKTYQEFNGDIDGWARASRGNGESFMTDADWYLLDELLMGLTITGTGLASASFVREVEAKLRASTADDATRVALRTIVSQHRPSNAG